MDMRKEELDELVSCGCDECGCCGEDMWITSGCHDDPALTVWYTGGRYKFACLACGQVMMTIAGEEPESLDCTDHPESSHYARYKRGSGVVSICCAECCATICRVPVVSVLDN